MNEYPKIISFRLKIGNLIFFRVDLKLTVDAESEKYKDPRIQDPRKVRESEEGLPKTRNVAI